MINIFVFSFISSIYLVCAGSIFGPNKKNNPSEIYTTIFFGSFLLGFLGVLLNFFVPLNIEVNTIVFILISSIGFFFIIKKKYLYDVLYCSLLISLISTLILSYDTIYRPDANLYHLPFTQLINENKIIFGVSNIHFRFGHISILQYLNAIFYNSIFKENGILMPAAIIFAAFVLYFYSEIKKNNKKNIIYTFYTFLLFSYVLYGYNRYSEFGNDTISHLYFLLISSYFLKNSYEKNSTNIFFVKLLILSLFCFMLKTSLILVFIFPLYFFIFKFNKKYIFNLSNLLILLIAFSWIIKNIITSGCIIYPIEITCFNKFEWYSNNLNHLISASVQSLDNEAWTKGWPDYKERSISQEIYVENFYWVQTWLSNHGLFILKKISIFFVVILLLIFNLKRLITNHSSLKIKINNKIYLLFFFSLICVFIWFIRFPVFRYGSSYIVVLIISLSTIIAYKCDLLKIEINKFNKYLNICVLIFFILFSFKHTLRIYKNYDTSLTKVAWPEFPKIEDTKNISKPISLDGKFFYYLLNGGGECGYTSSPCTPFRVKKNIYKEEKKGYTFLLIKK